MIRNSQPASVTVVIPCYKCTETIERAVNSIANQSLLPEAVVLVDDCSPDDTHKKLIEVQKKHHAGWIKVIRTNENGGPGTARNVGWDESTTEFIAFLDSDDSWHRRKLEIQYLLMKKYPDLALTGHLGTFHSGESSDSNLYKESHAVQRIISPKRALFFNDFITRSVMLKRDLPFRFAKNKRHSEDYQLWLEILHSGRVASVIQLPLAYSYKDEFGAGGLSSQLTKMELGEIDSLLKTLKENRYPLFIRLSSIGFSFAKYLRRCLITYFKLAKAKFKKSRPTALANLSR
jgi:glycosyltransferase involved in cell wall biosynthesis